MSHLDDTGETYWKHWQYAIQFGLVMILVGLCVVVHAFVPSLFTHTGTKALRAMVKVLDEDEK